MRLTSIPEATEKIKAGEFIILVDDEDRENEGDLAIAAEKVTPEAINFMARYARGLICLPIIGRRLDELQVPLMVQDGLNTSGFGTAFPVSIQAKHRATPALQPEARAVPVPAVLDPTT